MRMQCASASKSPFGTDKTFDQPLAGDEGAFLAKLSRCFTPKEVQQTAAATNTGLRERAGPPPCHEGKLGRIEVGAYADFMLVNGSPPMEIDLVACPQDNLALIMKNGVIIKNSIGGPPAKRAFEP